MPKVIIKAKGEKEEIKEDMLNGEVIPKNKEEFTALIEKYKKENPEKYAIKKAELEAKLRRL